MKQASAADHLANERTYLAWIRTALGIMAFGFVVVKFALFINQIQLLTGQEVNYEGALYSKLTGIIMLIFGGVILIYSYMRYNKTKKQLLTGNYQPAGRIYLILLTGIIMVALLLIFYLIVFDHLN